MFKGIFIADLHCSKSRIDGCTKVLSDIYMKLKEYNKHERPYLFIAGDFWDSIITNGEYFAVYVSMMKDIINLTSVFMIYGTPTHEAAGSLEVFKHLGAHVFSKNTFKDYGEFELVAIPEPRKVNYKTVKDLSLNDVVNNDLLSFADSIPEKTKPRILLYHGEIRGIDMGNGQVCNSPIAVSPSYLKSFNADFIACGHIHTKQEIFENCWYLGSTYQKGFAEKHDPGYLEIVVIGE